MYGPVIIIGAGAVDEHRFRSARTGGRRRVGDPVGEVSSGSTSWPRSTPGESRVHAVLSAFISSAPADQPNGRKSKNEPSAPARSWMPHFAPAFSCMALAIALRSS